LFRDKLSVSLCVRAASAQVKSLALRGVVIQSIFASGYGLATLQKPDQSDPSITSVLILPTVYRSSLKFDVKTLRYKCNPAEVRNSCTNNGYSWFHMIVATSFVTNLVFPMVET
jgi:hypothetical protein